MLKTAAILGSLLLCVAASEALAEASPDTCQGAQTVTAADALKLFKGNIDAMKSSTSPSALPTVFVDPRKVSDFQKAHIPGAQNLPIEEGAFTKDALWKATSDGAKPVVFYCNGENCPRSFMACGKAKEFGYKSQIYYFWTGMGPNGWSSVNGPTVAGDKAYPNAP